MRAAVLSSKFGGELITWGNIGLCVNTHNTLELCLTEDASFLRRAAEQLIQPERKLSGFHRWTCLIITVRCAGLIRALGAFMSGKQ